MFKFLCAVTFSKDRMLSFLCICLIYFLKNHFSSFLIHFIRLYQVAMTSFDDLLHHGWCLVFLLGVSTRPIAHHAIPLLLLLLATAPRFAIFGYVTYLSLSDTSRGARTFSCRSVALFGAWISIIGVIVNYSDTMMLFKVSKNVPCMRLVLLHRCSSFKYLINHNFSLRFVWNVDDSLYHIVSELIPHQIL